MKQCPYSGPNKPEVLDMSKKLSSIEKILLILKKLSEEPFEFTAKEISKSLAIPRPTIHRMLNTLEKQNFVKKNGNSSKYSIGYCSYEVGMTYVNRINVYTEIKDIIDEVAKITRQQVGYTVLENQEVISIYESQFFHMINIKYDPGKVYNINCGVYGKVLMAYSKSIKELEELVYKLELKPVTPRAFTDPDKLLEEYKKIRRLGYSESDGEYLPGTIGIGAPSFRSDGTVHGCVGLAGIKSEDFLNKKHIYIDEVVKGANKISKLL